MIFRQYWDRLSAKLIKRTPGIGEHADADLAVRRSARAVRDAESTFDKMQPAAEYLKRTAADNHFRERVAEVLTRRATS